MGTISKKIVEFTNDLSNNPLWADIRPFMEKMNIRRLLPKVKTILANRKELQSVFQEIFDAVEAYRSVDEDSLQKYANYYRLDTSECQLDLSTFYFENHRLAVYKFAKISTSPKPKILLIHGYFEHSLINAPLIKYLLDSGFDVHCFDLPGHGFSSGERHNIADFDIYSRCLKKVIAHFACNYHALVAHSTGCAAVIDFLGKGNHFPGKVIFASPLVKSYQFEVSKIGANIAGKVTSKLPFIFHKHSNDPDFLLFKRFGDFHSPKILPLGWFSALVEWNELCNKFPVNNQKKIYVFQGTCDRTVGWKYNLEYIKEKYPLSEITVIKGAEHNLFNDLDIFSDKVLNGVIEILKEK